VLETPARKKRRDPLLLQAKGNLFKTILWPIDLELQLTAMLEIARRSRTRKAT
jgi:hypothetical protein